MNFQQAFNKIYSEDPTTLVNEFEDMFPQHKLWLMPALLASRSGKQTVWDIESETINNRYDGSYGQMQSFTPYLKCSIYTCEACDYLFDRYSTLLAKELKEFLKLKMANNEKMLTLNAKIRIAEFEDNISRPLSNIKVFNYADV